MAFWARIGRGGLLGRAGPDGLLNKDRAGWPRKLEQAGKAVFCSPKDAR